MVLHRLYNIHRVFAAAAICAVLTGPVVAAGESADAQASDVYRNARFGYSICYPGKLLIAQRESENGDGRKFFAKDGAELAVWAGHNVLENTVAQQMQDTISGVQQDGGIVTYKVIKENWFVISGEVNGLIYYQKTICNADRIANYRLAYNHKDAARYNIVIRQLNNCLRD